MIILSGGDWDTIYWMFLGIGGVFFGQKSGQAAEKKPPLMPSCFLVALSMIHYSPIKW